jgi:Replication-relaxation
MIPTRLLSIRASEVLRLVSKLRFATSQQLQSFLFLGSSTTTSSQRVMLSRVLKSLRAADLVTVLPREVGGPTGGSGVAVYTVTAAGARLAARFDESLTGGRVARGNFLMRHALTTADVILAFHRAADQHGHELTWQTDWQVALRLGSGTIIPDAHLVYATAESELEALLEVDLGTEGSRFFAGKIARYLALWRSRSWHGTFTDWPVVLVVAPTEQRARLLRQTTEATLRRQADRAQVMAGTEFAFAALPQLLKHGPLAQVWQVAGREEVSGLYVDNL